MNKNYIVSSLLLLALVFSLGTMGAVKANAEVAPGSAPGGDICQRVDVDDSGLLNIEDFNKFPKLFSEGNKRVDIDQNGVLNVMDFTAFQSGYALCSIPSGSVCQRADMDLNGKLDVNDFTAFQKLFSAGNTRADFDQSGTLDIKDFPDFQTGYALCAGGPGRSAGSGGGENSIGNPGIIMPGTNMPYGPSTEKPSAPVSTSNNEGVFVGNEMPYAIGGGTSDPGNSMCRGIDIDANGKLDVSDFSTFKKLLSEGSKRVDINQDSAVNVRDMTEFQNRFAKCAPKSRTDSEGGEGGGRPFMTGFGAGFSTSVEFEAAYNAAIKSCKGANGTLGDINKCYQAVANKFFIPNANMKRVIESVKDIKLKEVRPISVSEKSDKRSENSKDNEMKRREDHFRRLFERFNAYHTRLGKLADLVDIRIQKLKANNVNVSVPITHLDAARAHLKDARVSIDTGLKLWQELLASLNAETSIDAAADLSTADTSDSKKPNAELMKKYAPIIAVMEKARNSLKSARDELLLTLKTMRKDTTTSTSDSANSNDTVVIPAAN